ncbi:putative glycosyl transferase [Roseovarius gaetbuli]|uniref:Putative glycosyl transferase n=1 Tax=Roseovarius gaetbuli TaxID=1356575 RepID=A0A1X6Y3F7_9RHOB|nr:glycosyltransferase [Roseovarius gaetbuli]SLN09753.1 putative glycosyl transferase [Roseovarius gaetbuli]
MEFTIIIPVFNAGSKIAHTIESLLSQTALATGEARLSCIVVDGASSDDTLDHVRGFDDPRITILSEQDSGMYDALAKGLARAGGDVTGYLPAGETFDPHAFSVITEVLSRYPEVQWVTGHEVTRNEKGQIINCRLPHPFRRSFFDCGMYGTRLTVLQQESTLWRSGLNTHFDLEKLATCKLAGDYFLWRSLARHQELYVIDTHIGSFTVEPDQLSKQTPGGYRREIRALRRRPNLLERLHALLYRQYVKRTRPQKKAARMLRYDHDTQRWLLTRP